MLLAVVIFEGPVDLLAEVEYDILIYVSIREKSLETNNGWLFVML